MAEAILLCGRICSGKTTHAQRLREEKNAVVLSCDEITAALFDNDLGDAHDAMTDRIRGYLMDKSLELVGAGVDVILDWGFWNRKTRQALADYYMGHGVPCRWHYIDADDATWQKNIAERNERVSKGLGGSDYYLDEGLLKKCLSAWQEPSREEMDVWVELRRD